MSAWTITFLALALAIYLCRHRIAGIVQGLPVEQVKKSRTESMHESTEDTSEETTPKAQPAQPSDSIPTMVLDSSTSVPEQEPTLMPPPASPKQSMPPPPPPSSRLAVQRGPAPSRLSPAAQARQTLAPSLAPTSSTMNNARGKVILAPGHSPLDWAALSRSTNLSGVHGLQRVTPSMLKSHHGRKGTDAWSSYRGKVYNISPYLPFHPGGEGQLMRAAGKDGTKLFEEAHAWVNWDNMMSSCVVGIMVPEAEQGLDDLD